MMRRLIYSILLLSLGASTVSADDVKLVTPGALLSSLKMLMPRFHQESGHNVVITLSPALAVPQRLERDAFDVAILGQGAARELEQQGKLVDVAVVARSGVGAFVRRGDPKPDISDVDA